MERSEFKMNGISIPIVQELAHTLNNGDTVESELLNRYVLPEEQRGRGRVVSCEGNLPIIDMQLLPDSAEQMKHLTEACESWGFFQIVNHGISTTLIEKLKAVAKEFFNLPLKERLECAKFPDALYPEGYGQSLVFSEDQQLEWADALVLNGLPLFSRDYNFWPEQPSEFRETVDTYCRELDTLACRIMHLLGKNLGLDPDTKLLGCEDEANKLMLGINYYPPCPKPELAMGISPHSDGCFLTILLQDDDVEGLQIRREGRDEWFVVKPIPGAFVVKTRTTKDKARITVYEVKQTLRNSTRVQISIPGPLEGLPLQTATMDMEDARSTTKRKAPWQTSKRPDINAECTEAGQKLCCHMCTGREKAVGEHLKCRFCTARFCRRCLRTRHGEDLHIEKADDGWRKWVCPKCRKGCGDGCEKKCCTCSKCRSLIQGTGRLPDTARSLGFSNVHDYLVHLETGESPLQVSSRKLGKGWCKTPPHHFAPSPVLPRLPPHPQRKRDGYLSPIRAISNNRCSPSKEHLQKLSFVLPLKYMSPQSDETATEAQDLESECSNGVADTVRASHKFPRLCFRASANTGKYRLIKAVVLDSLGSLKSKGRKGASRVSPSLSRKMTNLTPHKTCPKRIKKKKRLLLNGEVMDRSFWSGMENLTASFPSFTLHSHSDSPDKEPLLSEGAQGVKVEDKGDSWMFEGHASDGTRAAVFPSLGFGGYAHFGNCLQRRSYDTQEFDCLWKLTTQLVPSL